MYQLLVVPFLLHLRFLLFYLHLLFFIFSAAMPRTRHRACDEQKGDRKGMDYGGFDHSFALNGASLEIENL